MTCRGILVGIAVTATALSADISVGPRTVTPGNDPVSLRKRLETLQQQAVPRPADEVLVKHWANYHTAVRNARFILETYEYATASYIELVQRDLEAAAFALRVLSGKERDHLRPGLEGEGYFADNDASFQPFLRFVPTNAPPDTPMPLVIFLHGYFPSMNRVNWQYIPDSLQAFAQKEGFCVAAPFGRSNTDYQGIGEQDTLRVLNEMQQRYPIDASRIFLAGISMGGMGVWTIGGHYPNHFAGLISVCGRADYYFWQNTPRHTLPSYKQRLIDAGFGYPLLATLTNTPVFCVHGEQDPLIPVREARHAVALARQRKLDLTYVELPGASHWIYEETFARADLHAWMKTQRRTGAAPPSTPPPASPSRIRQAFMDRFVFVSASPGVESASDARFEQAVRDWFEFAKSPPRRFDEATATPAQLGEGHVFLFGEPEESAYIRTALKDSPVQVTAEHYVVDGRRFPRKGHGLYLARPHPWSKDKTAVIQCGEAWGAGLSFNHKYDLLPDFIIYAAESDPDGSNTALCAGFFDDQWRIDPDQLYVRESTSTETPIGQ